MHEIGAERGRLGARGAQAAEIALDVADDGGSRISASSALRLSICPARLCMFGQFEDAGTACNPASACHQRLHGLSLIDGTEKFGGPATIDATIQVAGTGDGSIGGMISFQY